jgi:hypothetical protein
MRSAILTALLVTLAVAACAPAAGANTLFYTDTSAATDPTSAFLPIDQNGPTTCGSATSQQIIPVTLAFKAYAFRNASGSSDCITVTGSNDCTSGATFDVTGAPAGGLLGSDDPNAPGCAASHSHSFTSSAGQAFVSFVFENAAGVPFGLSVSGTNVVPVHALSASADLPASNSLTVKASSLEDGTGVDGTLTVTAGPGHRYSGPVHCLRISGHNASVVMTFDGTEEGLASKWKGAVYWLHQSQDGQTDGQRNSILDQRQLNTTYASCPNPDAPPRGSFNTVPNHQAVLVVANGPQATV